MFKRAAYGCLKEGIFWEGGENYRSIAYSGEEGGYILEGGLDSGRDAYLRGGGGHILGVQGRFWGSGIDSFERRIYLYTCIYWKEKIKFWDRHFI